jgi:hypothetical protein
MQRLLFTVFVVALTALAAAPARAASDDQAKAEQIATHLRDSGRMRDYSVGVKYSGGTVWLSGRVATSQQMQNALEVVSEADGVEKIVNNLAIAPSAPSGGQPTAKKTAAEAASFSQPSPASQWDSAAIETPSIPRDNAVQPSAASVKNDSQVTPAGYHRLAARKAARHACPPTMYAPIGGTANPPAYDQPYLPSYAWPSYAAYPNYAALTYPRQYSPTAWPYIGPFYPYPQVPLGWRKVALEWDDGWWFLDFYDRSHH